MKAFTALRRRLRESPRWRFAALVAGFYGLMMLLYAYFMLANLSSAGVYFATSKRYTFSNGCTHGTYISFIVRIPDLLRFLGKNFFRLSSF